MADDLGRTTSFDRLADAVLDGVQIVPVAGPIVALIARQAMPRDSVIYLGMFAKEVAERIEGLEDSRLDREYIRSDAFREDVEQVLDAQVLLTQRRKREHFAAALVNAAATDRPSDVERRRMIDALVKFRLSHLDLLAAAAVSPKEPPGVDSVDGYIQSRAPGMAIDLIRLEWQDLVAEGLADPYPTGMAIAPAWERFRLTDYGRRFVRFVAVA